MTKDIQKIEPKELTSEDVKQYLCPAATDKEIFMFLQIAKTCNLNPFLKQIYLVKYGTQAAQILTSYNVYLQRAERSKKYAGLETTTVGSVKSGDLKAVVKVFRKDWEKPLIHEVYYEEYVQMAKDKETGKMYVNKFWREKPRTMIVKVAISQAFRLAFPLDFEGMPYTQDEINTIDIEPNHQKSTVSMPSATEKPVEEAEVIENEQLCPGGKEYTEEGNTGQSGEISAISAKELIEYSQKQGYTQAEVYEIIGKLGYKKVINILAQDHNDIHNSLSTPAVEWRVKQEQIRKEWEES